MLRYCNICITVLKLFCRDVTSVYLRQGICVHRSGPKGFAEYMLSAARAPDGCVLWPPQRVMAAHCHGYSSRATAALWAVKGWGHALTPPQQQIPRTEVTRHWRRTSLHQPPVAMVVVGAAKRTAEETIGSLPPVTVNRKYDQS